MNELPLPPRAGPVIDAGGRVVEPDSAWAALPDHQRPRRTPDADGLELVLVDDTELASFDLRSPAQPGGWDPYARLADMNREGIDQVVLYPTVGLSLPVVEDATVAVALARAYNDWLARYCAADPYRLFGSTLLPLQDPEAAVTELCRAVGELGFVGGFVRPLPCLGRSLSDPAYEPLWQLAEELDVAIGVDEGRWVSVPALDAERLRIPQRLRGPSPGFENMGACAQLIAGGIFERHPGLRVVFLASSGSWAPFWLEHLDAHVELLGPFSSELTLLPSGYFARQCSIAFDVAEDTLPVLAPFVRSEGIVWGSDNSGNDATPPSTVEDIRATVAPSPTATQARLLGLNARHLYRLPRRDPGVGGLIADYFAAVTAHDAELLGRLFAPDAVFDVDGEIRRGRAEILDYYRHRTFTFEDFRPTPGPLEIDGNHVTVAIDVHLGGADTSVRDVFEIDSAGAIASLEVRGFAQSLSAAR